MNIKKIKKNKGFVLLFVIVISSIILAITLSIMNISLKEIKFGTSARDTNDAFFAADTGSECALFNDKSTSNSFVQNGGTGTISCLGNTISLNGAYPSWNFILSGLGSSGKSCAKVTVDKTVSPVSVISKGYNIGDASCLSSSTNRVERELQMTFVASSPPLGPVENPCRNYNSCGAGSLATNPGPFNQGYKFTVNKNGVINALWAKTPDNLTHTVRLYDNVDGSVLASVDINGNTGMWVSGNLTTPVSVISGHSYVVAVRITIGNSSYYEPVSMPFTAGNITVNESRLGTWGSDAIPTSVNVTYMYGIADITFQTN